MSTDEIQAIFEGFQAWDGEAEGMNRETAGSMVEPGVQAKSSREVINLAFSLPLQAYQTMLTGFGESSHGYFDQSGQ